MKKTMTSRCRRTGRHDAVAPSLPGDAASLASELLAAALPGLAVALAAAFLTSCGPSGTARAEEPPALVKISGWESLGRVQSYDPAGFPCFETPQEPHKELLRLYYKHPLVLGPPERTGSNGAGPDELVPVRLSNVTCFISAAVVGPVHTVPVECLASVPTLEVPPISSLVEMP
ncbi:MAG: hypothetical protein FJ109_20145, partial [Deltaproteobacteria bacterium]|nr:hypothetical protein [Deltaproteobacteria bacterium]